VLTDRTRSILRLPESKLKPARFDQTDKMHLPGQREKKKKKKEKKKKTVTTSFILFDLKTLKRLNFLPTT